jgi:hypothetical protein
MDRDVEREIEANEQRGNRARDDKEPSVVATVEDAVSTIAKPLSNQRPTAEDAERQREANDAEQRQ